MVDSATQARPKSKSTSLIRKLSMPAVSRYLKGDRIGTVQMRQAITRDHREDVRQAWSRASALAVDVMQNNGRFAGAVDQVLADTIGDELILSPNPDFSGMKGWTEKRKKEWISIVKKRWFAWSSNPLECDLRGKQTIAQATDASGRWGLVFGESTGFISYLTPDERQRRGCTTGTKLCMIAPHKLVQETNAVEGIYQGVVHSEDDGLPIFYRFKKNVAGIPSTQDYPARDNEGRRLVLHAMDGEPGDVRGISKFAPSIKTWLQYDQLTDSTHAQQLLQSIFGITMTSQNLDGDALEAIMNLSDVEDEDVATEFVSNMLGYNNAKLESAAQNGIDLGTHGRINSLPAGDKLEFHTAGNINDSYVPLSLNLLRESARCLGISASGMTMDYSDATYSSVRMETASIWPIVTRRRKRLCAPTPQIAYESWLDEEIGEGRIPFFGGYEAFMANRSAVTAAVWGGPAKPTADDLKSARATSERLLNRTSTIDIEAAEKGLDGDELIDQQISEHRRLISEGMQSPYDRNTGGGDASQEEKESEGANGQ